MAPINARPARYLATAHDSTRCADCADGQPCRALQLHYTRTANAIVEHRVTRRTAGGPS